MTAEPLAPIDPITDVIASTARWLLNHVEWLRHNPAGPAAVDEIHFAVRKARKVIDHPPVGRSLPCPSAEDCGGRVWVTIDTIQARCDTCEWETIDLQWLGRLLRADEQPIVDAYAACHRLLVEGYHVTPTTIRKWAERGKIEPRNQRGPTCQVCAHDTCRTVREQVHRIYNLDDLRRLAPRAELRSTA